MTTEKRPYLYNVPNLKLKRRKLRSNSTPTEKILWPYLKNSQLGVKFRRQFSIEGYILDFYCVSQKIAIELDGEIHLKNIDYDNFRDKYLKSYGITTLRFKNFEVGKDIEHVLSKIRLYTKPPPV